MTNTKWTLDAYIDHNNTVQKLENKFQEERDRRYAEVAVEREKALRIKETADLAALELARESQVYKDERNDAMREQTLASTGIYATHSDVATVAHKMETSINLVAERMETALAPLASYVSSQKGSDKGTTKTVAYVVTSISILFGLAGLIITILKLN